MANEVDSIIDWEAREICERIVRRMRVGDAYGAYDEIDRVFNRGVERGKQPPTCSAEELIAEVESELELATQKAEEAEERLRDLRWREALKLVSNGK